MPQRIQLRRTKGWQLPDGAVRVDRATAWGNPYRVGATEHCGIPFAGGALTVKEAVGLFRAYARSRQRDFPNTFEPLRGHDLACWCPLGQPCHADVLLEIANEEHQP
jgi:hypothetical protein